LNIRAYRVTTDVLHIRRSRRKRTAPASSPSGTDDAAIQRKEREMHPRCRPIEAVLIGGLLAGAAAVAAEASPAPPPADIKHRAEQIKNLHWGMFICWSFSTFSGKEWTPGVADVSFFRAKECDVEQWVRTAKEAEMGYILFLTKHHDGFCLWNTKTTDRKVTKAPLGRDVLADLRKACDKHGIKLALYFSEGDWTWPEAVDGKGGKGGRHPEMKEAQLRELLTGYGPIEFIWFDHAVGDGGLSHEETVRWVHEFQPGCLVGFNHGEPAGEIRLGEMGHPSSLSDPAGAGFGQKTAEGYKGYLLAEFTYPIQPPHEGGAMWFYSLPRHDTLCHPAEKLYRDYVGAVQHGNIFSIDVGPDYRGCLRDIDVQTLRTVGQMIRDSHAAPVPTTSAASAADTPAGARFPNVPGVVIDHAPQSSGLYIGSPGLAALPDGAYLASHDFFGPKSTEHQRGVTVVFRSSDRGRTWRQVARLDGLFWASLFTHKGAAYLLGTDRHHGHLVIRRSTDGGTTWTEPRDTNTGLLTPEGEYHTAPVPVVVHDGRIWRASEDAMGGTQWGARYRAFMLSAPVDADLLKAESWTFSNRLARSPEWLGGRFGGWLEGNAVVTRDGHIVNVLRVETPDCPEKAAIVSISDDGRVASFNPEKGFIDFPGGAKKFTIRYDPKSGLYWSLASIVLEQDQKAGRPGGIRNTLALTCSKDLIHWTVRHIVLHHADTVRHGFQYVDWQFDGDDLIAACRTAFDDGLGGAHNAHDANGLTFHRIADFRTKTMADSAPAATIEAAPTTAAAPAPNTPGRPRIVNIINFIRGVEPRSDVDLLEPVRQQIRLVHEYKLPATFLVQYDALTQDRFVKLLQSELTDRDEIGAWLEVVQPQVEAAGLKWRGRFPWDWHADVGFTIGYTPTERQRLIDVYMREFEKAFGRRPRSVGCWLLDAPTLAYLADKYGAASACICKDQTGTDGYTLWGGYWNQAYYPSRLNGFMPAQTREQQIPIPVFRMLGSDPIYQYDTGLGEAAQGVVTLEPVYTGGTGGGGVPRWVRWFFDTTFGSPCLAFAYTQLGQENSFGWPLMAKGLTDQVRLVADLARDGKVRVETLGESGRWFRERFPLTPATAVTAMEDWKHEDRASIWYDSRYYRVNLFWDKDGFRVRDIHLFDERYPERYLKERVTTNACTYDTLPALDGFNWSTKEHMAGIRPVWGPQGRKSGPKPLRTGEPTVSEAGPDTLLVTMPLEAGGTLEVRCEPTTLTFEVTGQAGPAGWNLQMTWTARKSVPITRTKPNGIRYRHNGFEYALRCTKGVLTPADNAPMVTLAPVDGRLVLNMSGDRAPKR
jgi:alpha-L-fucosidase